MRALVAGAMCVELLVNLCHHPSKGLAAASASGGSQAEGATGSPLGDVPHQIRGFLSDWSNMILSAQAFSSWYIGPAPFYVRARRESPLTRSLWFCSTACSSIVRKEYRERGIEFVTEALQKPEYLEELTGLAELKRRAVRNPTHLPANHHPLLWCGIAAYVFGWPLPRMRSTWTTWTGTTTTMTCRNPIVPLVETHGVFQKKCIQVALP